VQLVELLKISGATPIASLPQPQLKELQAALGALGYPAGTPDGRFGPNTQNAWAAFKTATGAAQPDMIGPDSVKNLSAKLKSGGGDFSTKAGTIAAIKAECARQGIGLKTQMAYVLATTDHETNHTFQPVREAYWLSEDWRRQNLRYYPYYGRGYVQITWKSNYAKYGQLLGVDLVGNPDLAMVPKNALFILVHGFTTGGFTGVKLADYVNASTTDFFNARRCINALDKAQEIADLARTYL
jgi:predicted chitinase